MSILDVVHVDDSDTEVGSGHPREARKKDLAVRIARIFIINSHGELLIQRRSAEVSSPNQWDQSAAGHVDAGEEPEKSAVRELEEEMGVKDIDLEFVLKYFSEEIVFGEIAKRFNYIYTGEYNGEVVIDGEEVSDYKWVKPAELDRDMQINPQDYTEGFKFAYEKYKEGIAI